MVDGAYEDGKAAQAVKAEATLARVDGLAQSLVFEEIGVRDARGERQPGRAAGGGDIGAEGANLLRQADHDDVTETWLRSTKRKTRRSKRRRRVHRAVMGQRRTPRASQGMEKRSRGLPSRRLWRRR
jgi:hypothetical protein